MKRRWLPVWLLMTVPSCGSAESAPLASTEQPIVGGELALDCQWAATVSLARCSATLVHPRLVTTAAHCLTGRTPTEIVIGESIQRAARAVPVARCALHPDYRSRAGHDFGFCTLAEPVDLIAVPAMTACEARQFLHAGQRVVLAGFGDIGVGQSGGGQKRWVETSVQHLQNDEREVVVGTVERGACTGDSGGSAYIELPDGTWRSFGVTSRRGPATDAEPAASCASTSLYTSIPAHRAWLEAESGVDLSECGGAPCDTFPLEPGRQGTWLDACAEQKRAMGDLQCDSVSDGGLRDCSVARRPSRLNERAWLVVVLACVVAATRRRCAYFCRDGLDAALSRRMAQ